ncbi:hypothetical protein GCM10009593_27800 [Microlunatus antarcticus]|uniref:Uncharacterized protein n=1 Tax=Microlunatus antarcticus TaxID=53388 RepID=A0A7W5JSW2_9ACTN|nr:hypothetical protein [Microlunatus antarcticus]
MPDGRDGPLDGGVDRCRVGDVAPDAEGTAADLRRAQLGGVLVEVDDDDLRPRVGEDVGDRRPDAGDGTGDERDPSVEAEGQVDLGLSVGAGGGDGDSSSGWDGVGRNVAPPGPTGRAGVAPSSTTGQSAVLVTLPTPPE